jgi:regulator of sigma E protease
VKFRGDADPSSATIDEEALASMSEEERQGSFPAASLPRRAAIVAAGPMFNFILAAVLFGGLAYFVGMPTDRPVIDEVEQGSQAEDAGFRPGDKLAAVNGQPVTAFSDLAVAARDSNGAPISVEVERDGSSLTLPFAFTPPIIVQSVRTDGAAAEAGIEAGDVVTGVDGKKIALFEDLRDAVLASEGKPITISLLRDGEPLDVTATPEMREIRDEQGEIVTRYLLGVTHSSTLGMYAPLESASLLEAAETGVSQTYGVLSGTVFFIYELFAGRGDVGDLGGPIRIAEFSGQAAERGPSSLITLMAVLSASIGLINLFPIPVLDGGHLLFYAIEAIRGKPLNERAQEIGLTIGFALIITLMLFATYNDVIRL